MKTFFSVALLSLALSGCNKSNNDPTPAPATAVQGDYTVTHLAESGNAKTSDNFDLAFPYVNGNQKLSAMLQVRQGSNSSSVKIQQIFSQTGQADIKSDLPEFTLNKAGSGYDLIINTTKFGTIDGTNLSIDITDSGVRYLYEAKK